jgi:dihydrofolate reductase
MSNIVYIATSLDGYIAGPKGELDWLDTVPNPASDDLGFAEFMTQVDAVVMGRITFEAVVGFGHGWPYPVPGLVLSTTSRSAPEGFADKVRFAHGTPEEIVVMARGLGYVNLYIDGGNTIQRFLDADLIDEMIVSEIPILLGEGRRLFGAHAGRMEFELLGTETMLGQILKKRYRRKR